MFTHFFPEMLSKINNDIYVFILNGFIINIRKNIVHIFSLHIPVIMLFILTLISSINKDNLKFRCLLYGYHKHMNS